PAQDLASRGRAAADLRDARVHKECRLRAGVIVRVGRRASDACGVRPHCAEMVRNLVRQTVRKLREATRTEAVSPGLCPAESEESEVWSTAASSCQEASSRWLGDSAVRAARLPQCGKEEDVTC